MSGNLVSPWPVFKGTVKLQPGNQRAFLTWAGDANNPADDYLMLYDPNADGNGSEPKAYGLYKYCGAQQVVSFYGYIGDQDGDTVLNVVEQITKCGQ